MWWYAFIRFLAIITTKILFRLEAEGAENVPASGGFILSSNHASYLDPIVLAASCPRQLSFMAKYYLFTIPIFGSLIYSVGAFPLSRNAIDISSIKEAFKRLRSGRGILIFPEGRRSDDGLVQDFAPGIGFIAGKSGVPVVPAFIRGSQRAFGRHARFIKPVKIKIYFGKPIHLDGNGAGKGEYEAFSKKIADAIKQLA